MSTAVISAKCHSREVRRMVGICLESGVVPYVQSSPGMGKSAIMRSLADEANLKLIDVRLSGCAPEDIQGLPKFDEKGFPHFMPFTSMFPVVGMELPPKLDANGKLQYDSKGEIIRYAGWLLFLDELPLASPAVQKASYRLILDHEVGEHKLHPEVYIAAAGNLTTDRALVGSMSTALASRVAHIFMETNTSVWMEDVAIKYKFDKRIMAFLGQYPSKLNNFNPESKEATFCCERTWEQVHKIIHRFEDIDDEVQKLLCGTISPGEAVAFVQYSKIFSQVIRIEDILKDPVNTPMPQGKDLQWATVASMVEAVNKANFAKLVVYAQRFDMGMMVLFFRAASSRFPELRTTPEFMQAGLKVSQYLNQK